MRPSQSPPSFHLMTHIVASAAILASCGVIRANWRSVDLASRAGCEGEAPSPTFSGHTVRRLPAFAEEADLCLFRNVAAFSCKSAMVVLMLLASAVCFAPDVSAPTVFSDISGMMERKTGKMLL